VEFARTNGFALVSLDADFADLATLFGSPPKVVWIRRGNQPTASMLQLIREAADSILAFSEDSASCLELY
jgi:predicted nuclease of predicted toxin-antitoxin system